jgi:prolyl-tRNA synthetase
MGTIVEVLSDEKGIVWPKAVAPFRAHIISIGQDDVANKLYESLSKEMEVLFDDRDASAGEKFADADLIGIPTQIIIGKKSVESGKFEVKDRSTGERSEMSETELVEFLRN